eukprot:TRINITY_DN11544_c0_g1_i1.p1 TRINITY_DN11544_c0_g1~~TRINITY_DN11544_c0_g1_i1.p1  ORF type:complete len:103 (+),score=9.72 TRINITY_DN11544_c0_g1_i1:138-446(+)
MDVYEMHPADSLVMPHQLITHSSLLWGGELGAGLACMLFRWMMIVMRCHTMDCSKEEGCDDALLWIVWMEICEGAKLRKDVSAGSPTRSWFSIVKRCEKVYA